MSNCLIHGILDQTPIEAFNFFDIGKGKPYFQVADLTDLKLFVQELEKSKNRYTLHISGVVLDQVSEDHRLIDSLQKAISNQKIELLGTTHYHSLSCLFSSILFKTEVEAFLKQVNHLFGIRPSGFLNSLSIYSNDLADTLVSLGFSYALAPRVPWFQGDLASHRAFKSVNANLDLVLLGDVAESQNDDVISYSVQPSVKELDTILVSEFVDRSPKTTIYRLPNPVACDTDGLDLTHYLNNALQKQVFKKISELAHLIIKAENETLTNDLLRLSSAYHFRQMGNHVLEDRRYTYYMSMINCLTDLELRC